MNNRMIGGVPKHLRELSDLRHTTSSHRFGAFPCNPWRKHRIQKRKKSSLPDPLGVLQGRREQRPELPSWHPLKQSLRLNSTSMPLLTMCHRHSTQSVSLVIS